MREKIFRNPKPAGWWTPERRKALWALYMAGESYADMAKHFETTIAAVERQIHRYKKDPVE